MNKLQLLLREYEDVRYAKDETSVRFVFDSEEARLCFLRRLNEIKYGSEIKVGYEIVTVKNLYKVEVFLTDDRYTEKPHKFKLVRFTELGAILFGPDDKCDCCTNDNCVDRHKTHNNRCTLEELKKLDNEAIRRRAWQSGGD